MQQCHPRSIFSLLPYQHILHLMLVLYSLHLGLVGLVLDIVMQALFFVDFVMVDVAD